MWLPWALWARSPGTEGFPEEVRLEPKLKRGYELTSPPLSEGSQ